VVTLEIIVDVGFPVAVHLVGTPLGKFHIAEIELLRLVGQFAEGLEQRGRFSVEVDENKIEPFLDADGNESKVGGIEILYPFKFGSDEEGAVETIGPAMVGATKELAVPATGSGITGAMAADIVKAAKNAILATGYEKRLPEQVEGEIIPGAGGLANMADELPSCREEGRLFSFKVFRAEIERSGQSGSAGDIEIDMKVGHERSGGTILAQAG
jgi:hypothetical protein